MGEPASNWPSGRWTGKWTDPQRPDSPSPNDMSLDLSFQEGYLDGSGRDRIGVFSIHGTYDPRARTCSFVKKYATHSIDYRGERDGKGIYGQWATSPQRNFTGGFHIWPSELGEKAETTREEDEEYDSLLPLFFIDAAGRETQVKKSDIVEWR